MSLQFVSLAFTIHDPGIRVDNRRIFQTPSMIVRDGVWLGLIFLGWWVFNIFLQASLVITKSAAICT